MPSHGRARGRQLTRDLIVTDSHRLPHEPRLCELIFAAFRLADIQIARRRRGNVCAECDTPQSTPAHLDHTEGCRTGRVLRLLTRLAEESTTLPHPDERRTAGSELTLDSVSAADEDRPPLTQDAARLLAGTEYSEPWELDSIGDVRDAHGRMVVNQIGAELAGVEEETEFLGRIVACVNFCAGKATDELVAAVLLRVPEPIAAAPAGPMQ
jgi:hypothetical protein